MAGSSRRFRLRARLLAVVVGIAAVVLVPIPAEANTGPVPSVQAASGDDCAIETATLTWGFKEAFRSYISGTIAHGEWTTADGATYATPNFSWSSGEGSVDGGSGDGFVGFTGSVTFTGHGGILNTTLADPELRFGDNGAAVLLLDVSGTTQAGDVIDQERVEFATVDLGAATRASDGAVATFTDAPTVLLESGANAFGTYLAGEPLDPVTVSLTATGCGPIVTGVPADSPRAAADSGWLPWLVAGIVLLALGGFGAVWLVRRRAA